MYAARRTCQRDIRLSSVYFEEGSICETIGEFAFIDATNLTEIMLPESISSIGKSAFNGCSNLKEIYYFGTQEQWQSISKGSYNSALTSANIYYYSGNPPTTEGNFWYYDENGEIVIWS